MAILSSYVGFLKRNPNTLPLKEHNPGAEGIYLRHDVDHDLEIALEMALQEYAAARGLPTPTYALTGRTGAHHAPSFTVQVAIAGAQMLHVFGPRQWINAGQAGPLGWTAPAALGDRTPAYEQDHS